MKTLADWSTAPEWAQWFAIDSNGFSSWYEKMPFIAVGKNGDFWAVSDGAGMYGDHYIIVGRNWRELIEQRPQVSA